MSQKYEKLKNLLKELFQLDQPDLDFGLYRIMHARSKEITEFLDKDLLPQVKASFAEYKPADKATIQAELDKITASVSDAGMNPDESPKVRELRDKLKSEGVDISTLESEVYDHLFRFFRRYYSEGDFISKRVYKEGAYSIPYEGEEVKLHWANVDQYYIKTSEYLRDYAFRLNLDDDSNPRRVHFRLVDASEGEHGNVKESEDTKRAFILASGNFVFEEDGELVISFEFRTASLSDWTDDQKAGKTKPPLQKELITIAERRILAHAGASLAAWIADLSSRHLKANGELADYSKLVAHLNRYTARNTFDYFIHKDLGKFLNRELDFYIKNEVMHLDDVENESAPRVEQYLSKIKVIRKIAKKIIDFLSQLEDFQKKLWLKKKFVLETNYCVTLDRISESFYEEIAANKEQVEEWVKLFSIDDLNETSEALISPPQYTNPLSINFLKANRNLVLDTKFFSEEFKQKMITSMENLDNQIDGLLIYSENFQALNLIQSRYLQHVKIVYLDPPFNLGGNADYLYRVDYKDSSWMSLLQDRLEVTKKMISIDGSIMIRCNHDGNMLLRMFMNEFFGKNNYRNEIIVRRAEESKGDLNKQFAGVKSITVNYDNIYWYSMSSSTRFGRFLKPTIGKQSESHWHSFWKAEDRPNMRYEILGIDLNNHYGQWMWERVRAYRAIENYKVYKEVSEANQMTLEEYWVNNSKAYEEKNKVKLEFVERFGNGYSSIKYWIPPRDYVMADNNWLDIKGYSNNWNFQTENSEGLLKRIIGSLVSQKDIVMDFFAGSGTTAAVAHKLNRKWISVEMGEHFNSILKRRLTFVLNGEQSGISSEVSWSGGGFFKYIRLESYEDTLNNLDFQRSSAQESLLNFQGKGIEEFREDYILRYMLNVESKGSKSLLNVSGFTDPTAYELKVKIPGSDESRRVHVDLIETFNFLLGLQIKNISAPQLVTADFERNSEKRLQLKDRLKVLSSESKKVESWWFRTVTGTTLDGRNVLVIWRKRPGGELSEGVEKDNLVLNEWFTKLGYSSRDSEFDLIYVNGTNNLENLKTPDDLWKVRLIEEDFHRLMFEDSGD
ncbi:DNA methylase family protein [Leptospira meyeri serovar Hardjo str. Went 5]|uniref:DNA methyltransferase n=1 Tax=Leptospira meyeri TaxID=29508 RepID=UPI00028C976C|nr:site-specific DNA-methyltransferase [Leptospira meyeri]EKJ86151.1 DNA methylase family protein [Leptospira meyeri serovar Hardjo str. Went 5]